MILRTRSPYRCARLLACAAAATLLGTALFPGAAAADPVSDKQAQAQALAQQIDRLGAQESALAEQYNKATLDVQAAQAAIAQTSIRVAQANADASRARDLLRADSIDAYVHGGAIGSASGTQVDAQTAILRAAYVQTLASTQTDHLDGFRTAAAQAKAATASLETARQQAARTAAQLNSARSSTVASQRQLEASLSQVKGDIATRIAQIEAAKQAEATRQAQQLLARQQAAAEQPVGQQPTVQRRLAAALGPPTASLRTATAVAAPRPAPPVGAGAGAAVSAAMSRLGLPYVFGAAGPDSFDCSGLTRWAWAHAGVSLPHFSGAQYASTTHISMTDLQPGDLVFYADPGAHVAMYIGGGQIIAAPHTGTVVQVQALSGAYVHASRP